MQTAIPPNLQVAFDFEDNSEPVQFQGHADSDPGNEQEEVQDEVEQHPMPENEGANDDNDTQEPEPSVVPPPVTTRSGRTVRRTQRLLESTILPKLKSFALIAHHVTNTLTTLDDDL